MNYLYVIDENYYYVYEHIINDEVIYVGKGKGNRAFDRSRSDKWIDVVGDNKLEVVIKGYFQNESDAYKFEKMLIKEHLKTSNKLVNIIHNRIETNSELDTNSRNVTYKNPNKKSLQDYFESIMYDNRLSSTRISSIQQIPQYIKSLKEKNNKDTFKVLIFVDLNISKNDVFNILRKENLKAFIFDGVKSSNKIYEENSNKSTCSYDFLIINSLSMDKLPESYFEDLDALVMYTARKKDYVNLFDEFNFEVKHFACRSNDSSIPLYLDLNIVNKNLNIPLTSKDKEIICQEMNIINNCGRISKWGVVSKLIMKEGYKMLDSTKTIDGIRTRLTTISNMEHFTCRSNDSSIPLYLDLNIVNKNLNTPLTSKDKEMICQEMNIINNCGRISKWGVVRKLIMKEGYKVLDSTKTIDRIRTRVTIISSA